jgi:hypothetical protein
VKEALGHFVGNFLIKVENLKLADLGGGVCLHKVLESLVALRRRVYAKGVLKATFEEQQRLAVSTNHLEILISDNEVKGVWDSYSPSLQAAALLFAGTCRY